MNGRVIGDAPDIVSLLFSNDFLECESSMVLTVAALALGWPAAWMLARIASSFLYSIAPHDAVTFTLVPIVLVLVALIAAWIPARRAARINPIQALRME